MKRYLLIFLSLLLASLPAYSQLSLRDAASNALSKNKGLKSSELKIQARDYAVKSAWDRYMPEVGVSFTYTYLNSDLILNLDPIRSAMIELQSGNSVTQANLESLIKQQKALTPQEQLAVKNGAMAKLDQGLPHFKEILKEQAFPQAIVSLKQPIFTGGKILAGVKANEAKKKMEVAKFDGEKDEVLYDVATTYIKVLLAGENEKVRKDVLDGIRQHAYRANRMLEQGLIAMHDKLRADVALSGAEQNYYEATEKRKIAQMALISMIQSAADSVLLSDKMDYKRLERNISEFLLLIKESNSTIQQLNSARAAMDQKSNAEFADYFPTVFGFGFYNVFDHYIIKDAEPKWGVGIGANFTIFDGFKRSNNFQEAKKESESVELLRDEVLRKLELLARSQYMEMKLSEDRYMQLDASLDQAEENLKLNEKRYETGMGTSLEAIDAQLALEGIRLNKVKSLSDYYLNMAGLYKTVGRLDEFVEFWYSKNQ